MLLDIKMPKVNGFDVLAWLNGRPYLENLPVIVLSGSSFDTDAETAKHLGAREFLTKPNDFGELILLVNGIYARWLAKPSAQKFVLLPCETSSIRMKARFYRANFSAMRHKTA